MSHFSRGRDLRWGSVGGRKVIARLEGNVPAWKYAITVPMGAKLSMFRG